MNVFLFSTKNKEIQKRKKMETSILNKSPVRGEWLSEAHKLLKQENGFMQTLQFIISNWTLSLLSPRD